MKISTKLILGFLVIALIGASLGVLGIVNMNKMAAEDTKLYQYDTLGIQYSSSAGTFFQRLRYNALEMTILDTEEARQGNVAKIKEFTATIDQLLADYQNTLLNQEDKDQYEILITNWETYKGFIAQMTEDVSDANIDKVKQVIIVDSDDAAMSVKSNLESILDFNNKLAKQVSENNQDLAMKTDILMVIITVIAVLVSLVLGVIIARSISKPVNKIVQAGEQLAIGDIDVTVENNRGDEIGKLNEAFGKVVDNIRQQVLLVERIADGDLTVDVTIRSNKDLLGKKLAEMVRNNNELLSGITSTAQQVAVGSRQVSHASISLAQGATQQASSVEELTSSLEEISSQTDINAQNANQANQLAETVKVNAVQGNGQMREMLAAMEGINEASSNISKVIKVIDDIAFQTNILALNAAVEAARAGQHGKGFAVVAEEVRNLAARSANAAKETTEMIEGSIKKAESGTMIAKNTAEALDNIVSGVEKVANLVKDIAVASNEQAMGISQINQGIMQVSHVVQTNSATSEESASASEELSAQAALLKEAVGKYRLKQLNDDYLQAEKISPEVRMMLEDMRNKH